ncbi:hypothetical protein SAMN02745213_01169 [Succinivibrio dextrinosolvens DSM 3072]|uniref:Phosphopantetheine attachment site n=1 Tax=Succinivibrio dextrinosolvens DSM 3072 TaxID=1123324 RepID=A0A1T4VAB2_9GAMM|nr:acyl carrier protein [Succinivibrio dextrinosolvens]SKA61904.1 hypothetical protein SAMN02745213_01169 [Succinivibrio dextrinosolvens DSM 3072]
MKDIKEILFSILEDIHPEIDFRTESRNFVSSGILVSFDILQIIDDIEKSFNIKISGLDFIPENFSSIQSIENLVNSKIKE